METYYIAIISALIALCLLSHIFTQLFGGKSAKITFCIISALCLAASVVLELVWLGIVLLTPINPLVGKTIVEALSLALMAVSAAELAGLLVKKEKKPQAVKSQALASVAESSECALPSNVRKKGERIHGEYTIIKD